MSKRNLLISFDYSIECFEIEQKRALIDIIDNYQDSDNLRKNVIEKSVWLNNSRQSRKEYLKENNK